MIDRSRFILRTATRFAVVTAFAVAGVLLLGALGARVEPLSSAGQVVAVIVAILGTVAADESIFRPVDSPLAYSRIDENGSQRDRIFLASIAPAAVTAIVAAFASPVFSEPPTDEVGPGLLAATRLDGAFKQPGFDPLRRLPSPMIAGEQLIVIDAGLAPHLESESGTFITHELPSTSDTRRSMKIARPTATCKTWLSRHEFSEESFTPTVPYGRTDASRREDSESVKFELGQIRYEWPLPPPLAKAHAAFGTDERLRAAGFLPTMTDTFESLNLVAAIDPPTIGEDSSKVWAVFLTSAEHGPLDDWSLIGDTLLPSNSKSGSARFHEPQSKDYAPIAYTRPSGGKETTLDSTPYVWIRIEANGRPLLFSGGREQEPFDALGESEYRRGPRKIIETYTFLQRSIANRSPTLALLPTRGVFFEEARSATQWLRVRDVPRSKGDYGIREALIVFGLLALLWRFHLLQGWSR